MGLPPWNGERCPRSWRHLESRVWLGPRHGALTRCLGGPRQSRIPESEWGRGQRSTPRQIGPRRSGPCLLALRRAASRGTRTSADRITCRRWHGVYSLVDDTPHSVALIGDGPRRWLPVSAPWRHSGRALGRAQQPGPETHTHGPTRALDTAKGRMSTGVYPNGRPVHRMDRRSTRSTSSKGERTRKNKKGELS